MIDRVECRLQIKKDEDLDATKSLFVLRFDAELRCDQSTPAGRKPDSFSRIRRFRALYSKRRAIPTNSFDFNISQPFREDKDSCFVLFRKPYLRMTSMFGGETVSTCSVSFARRIGELLPNRTNQNALCNAREDESMSCQIQ